MPGRIVQVIRLFARSTWAAVLGPIRNQSVKPVARLDGHIVENLVMLRVRCQELAFCNLGYGLDLRCGLRLGLRLQLWLWLQLGLNVRLFLGLCLGG